MLKQNNKRLFRSKLYLKKLTNFESKIFLRDLSRSFEIPKFFKYDLKKVNLLIFSIHCSIKRGDICLPDGEKICETRGVRGSNFKLKLTLRGRADALMHQGPVFSKKNAQNVVWRFSDPH